MVTVVMRTFKIYSLSFQLRFTLSNFSIMYNTVLLTMVTMLCVRSSELINIVTESLYSLTL